MPKNKYLLLASILTFFCLFRLLAPNQVQAQTAVLSGATTTTATQNSLMRNIVTTSDGTIHAFMNIGTATTTCNGSSKSGLVWMYSTDAGATWTCGGQIDSETTNPRYASATVDSSDNIYLVYSVSTTGANTAYDVLYTKLTKGSGATWTVESAQTILDGTASIGYHNATVAIEGTTRLWMAATYYDGTNYQVVVYYSSDLTASPTWTVSSSRLDTAGTSTATHRAIVVRYGSRIGVVYNNEATDLSWRFRSDSDGLTSWSNEMQLGTTANMSNAGKTFSAIGDSLGNVYVASNNSTNILFSYYNGYSWSNTATIISGGASSSSFISISTDQTNVWIVYAVPSGNSALPGSRRMVYIKGVPPFTANDFDATASSVVSYHGVFDKYWSYVSGAYTDDTTDSSNNTAGDTQLVTGVGDIAYFGKSTIFDAFSGVVGTSGVGGVVTWEYYNGSSWSTLTFTDSASTNLTGSNIRGSFTAPSDWATTSINGEGTAYYYIRGRVTTAYTTAPVGTQFVSTPLISWASVIPNPVSGKIHALWTENTASPTRVRSTSFSVTTTTANTSSASNLTPYVAAYSNVSSGAATQASTQRPLVRTSDSTLHAFIQGGTALTCGNSTGSNNNRGLNWIYSTDNGVTWTCGGQLSSNTTNQMLASATTDSSDNIYVSYSMATSTGGTSKNVYYRKLTKGSGATWTLESEQTVLSGTSTVGYHYATIITEGTTRLWLASRYYDGTNYQIVVYYSDGLGAAPSWTSSIAPLETAGTSTADHWPVLVRFGSNIGVVYDPEGSNLKWRYRADSDGLTTWNTEATILTTGSDPNNPHYSAIGDSSGNVYFTMNAGSSITFTYYNGSTWSTAATISSAIANLFSSVVTNGTDVWVIYGDTTAGYSAGIPGSRTLAYKKGVSPFATANFDTNPTQIVSYHGVFNKVWTYISSTYADATTVAGNTTSADVTLPSTSGDIIYFGKSEKFGSVSWDVSTAGSSGQFVWEYYNGSTWAPILNFFVATNPTFNADGTVSFVPHSDWATTTINSELTAYYYVRARVITTFSVAPVGVQFSNTPPITWANFAPSTSGLFAVWTENANPTSLVRFWASNTAPSDPTSLGPASLVNGSYTGDSTPTLTFTLSDIDSSDTVKYQIQIDDTAGFGSPVVDYTSALASQGSSSFTVGQSAGSGTYTTGSSGQTLTTATGYYWRVKAIDSSGSESSWSTANSGSIAFYIDTTAPTLSLTAISPDPGSDSTPTLSGSVTDSGGTISSVQFQIDGTSGSWSSCTASDGTFNSASESFTCTASTLTDGSHTMYVRSTDSNDNTSSSSSDTFTIDTTAPSDISLDSPAGDAFTSNQRPTFRWKKTTDSASSISKYTLSLDNGDTGDITIDNIPVSGTSDVISDRFVIHFDGDYISVYTKSSTLWSSDQFDGKLKDGKRNWRVTATDTSGNTSSSSRDLYVDTVGPVLSNTNIENLGEDEGYLIITDPDIQFSGTITDNVAYQGLSYTLYKSTYFLGVEISKSVVKTGSYTLNNTSNAVTTTFDVELISDVDYGKYTLEIAGVDKAGNTSAVDELDFQIVTRTQAEKILKKSVGDKDSGSSGFSLPDLEKKALLRREKEASELAKLLATIEGFYNQVANYFGDSFSTIARLTRSRFAYLNRIRLSYSLPKLPKVTPPSLPRFTFAFKFNFAFPSIHLPGVDFKPFIAFLERASNASEQLADTYINNPLYGLKTNLDNSVVSLSKGLVSGLTRAFVTTQSFAVSLSDRYERDRSTAIIAVREINKDTNKSLQKAKERLAWALDASIRSVKRPLNAGASIANRTKVWVLTFESIVIDPNPTKITNVTIEEIGPDYAIVSWETNHYAWGKVNYGKSLSYGEEVLLLEREKYHKAKLTGLNPNEKYFFEVMSQNKNYAYDAYYSFETPEK